MADCNLLYAAGTIKSMDEQSEFMLGILSNNYRFFHITTGWWVNTDIKLWMFHTSKVNVPIKCNGPITCGNKSNNVAILLFRYRYLIVIFPCLSKVLQNYHTISNWCTLLKSTTCPFWMPLFCIRRLVLGLKALRKFELELISGMRLPVKSFCKHPRTLLRGWNLPCWLRVIWFALTNCTSPYYTCTGPVPPCLLGIGMGKCKALAEDLRLRCLFQQWSSAVAPLYKDHE